MSTPTPADREAAREWVEKNVLHGPRYQRCEEAFLAGMARSRPTWTGTPPDRHGWYWYRATPAAKPVAVLVESKAPDFISCAKFGDVWYSLTLLPDTCQWAGPLPTPAEPTGGQS